MKKSIVLLVLALFISVPLGCKKSSSPTNPAVATNTPSFTPTNPAVITSTPTSTPQALYSPTVIVSPCVLSNYVGTTIVGTSAFTYAGLNNLLASQITLSYYAFLNSASVYLQSASGAVRAGIYADNGSGPSTLIAETSPQAAVNGWNTIVLPYTYLHSGKYWIACQIQNSTQIACTSGGFTNYISFNWASFPSTYPTVTNPAAYTLSMYLTYCWLNTPTIASTPTPTITLTPTLSPTTTFTPTFTPTTTSTPGSGFIITVAGNGTLGYSGDSGAATSAELYDPSGVAVDSLGNIYIADMYNHRIRKVSTSGIITTVAGNGTYGYSGNGGAATSAELYDPSSVAVDSSGNIFIADSNNHSIRKVSTSGIITTVAGNGTYGYSGDSGAATSAELYDPSGVAVDSSGNIYIADVSNQRVRKVDTSGIITTVAGNGAYGYSGDSSAATSAELFYPRGVAVDSSGNIYIADLNNHRIRKVSTSGIITTVAGNGTYGYSGDSGAATSAELYNPSGVAVDSSGNIYIADVSNQRVRKVDTSGIITTVAGNGTYGYSGDSGAATSAELNGPYGVAVDSSGNIFIADLNNNRIRKVFH
jgi:sugar lactone lactonase YvrE